MLLVKKENGSQQIPYDLTVLSVLPEFRWPAGVGNGSSINWYGAIVDPWFTRIVGEMGT